MKSGKGHNEEEEEEEEDFSTRKDATSSANNSKDGKNSDRANAIRSKHSVTEQRRRSKINERFQILRELIPNVDQKRDTASFLLEVIQYVQFLQEKVHKYEGSYQPWNSEPTKLMPWRTSHWRVQGFSGQPQTPNNAPAFPARFDENNNAVVPTTILQDPHNNPIEPDHVNIDTQTQIPNNKPTMGLAATPMQPTMPVSNANDDGAYPHTLLQGGPPPPSDAQSAEYPSGSDILNGHDELAIEGGTISISSAYSQGLLNSLTQALESTGVDLSQASISVQINLGKRANRGGISIAKDHDEHLDQSQKRQKI